MYFVAERQALRTLHFVAEQQALRTLYFVAEQLALRMYFVATNRLQRCSAFSNSSIVTVTVKPFQISISPHLLTSLG